MLKFDAFDTAESWRHDAAGGPRTSFEGKNQEYRGAAAQKKLSLDFETTVLSTGRWRIFASLSHQCPVLRRTSEVPDQASFTSSGAFWYPTSSSRFAPIVASIAGSQQLNCTAQ
jgi:hypothetical protein